MAFAYRRGPSYPRCSPLTEKIVNDDGTGPLSGLGDCYGDTVGMAEESPMHIRPDTPPENSAPADIELLRPGESVSASVTEAMDTEVSNVQYVTQQGSMCFPSTPGSVDHQRGVVTSRPSSPKIYQDSWSKDATEEEKQEQLDTLSSDSQRGVPAQENHREAALQLKQTSGSCPHRRCSSNHARSALAPITSQACLQLPNAERAPHAASAFKSSGHNCNKSDVLSTRPI